MTLILANLDLWVWTLTFEYWTTNFSNDTNYLAIRISVIRGIRSAVLVVYELTSYLWFFLKLKRLYNKSHRATERTEIKAMSRRWGWYKERGRCSIQLPNNSWDKCFEHRISNKTGKQSPSLHAPTVPSWLPMLYFDNPPYPPFLCVTFRQRPMLRRIVITPKHWIPKFLLCGMRRWYRKDGR